MSIMGEIAAEREEALNDAHITWLEAEEELRKLQAATEIMQRTGAEWLAIVKQREICGVRHMQYERAKRDRFRVVATI